MVGDVKRVTFSATGEIRIAYEYLLKNLNGIDKADV